MHTHVSGAQTTVLVFIVSLCENVLVKRALRKNKICVGKLIGRDLLGNYVITTRK